MRNYEKTAFENVSSKYGESVTESNISRLGAESWFAVHTKARHEKKTNRDLEEKDVETFLPLREVMSQWKDRKKKVFLPLFPGQSRLVDARSLDEVGVRQTRRREEVLAHPVLEALTSDLLDDAGQHRVTAVVVLEALARATAAVGPEVGLQRGLEVRTATRRTVRRAISIV